MRSFIFSSEYQSARWFLGVFFLLLALWESVIRAHYNPPVDVDYSARRESVNLEGEILSIDRQRRWYAFGNCLVLNGISPKLIIQELSKQVDPLEWPWFLNISQHENAPQAYLRYLEMEEHYPEVIFTNVSSWINSDNYLVEAKYLQSNNLIGSFSSRDGSQQEAAGISGQDLKITFQELWEDRFTRVSNELLKLTEKRYHLFDFGFFLFSYFRTLDLEQSLYNLSIQSWFKLREQVNDGHGGVAFRIEYGNGWERAREAMVERQISRMQLGNFLTGAYWSSLEEAVDHFEKRGTQVVLLRMPEAPPIYRFNEMQYQLSQRAREVARATGADFIDLNEYQFSKNVRLYDAVHPDYQGTKEISRFLADWIIAENRDWLLGSNDE